MPFVKCCIFMIMLESIFRVVFVVALCLELVSFSLFLKFSSPQDCF